MLLLGLGLLAFFALHLIPTAPGIRAGLIERFGASAYKGVFSILSLAAFALIIYGYQKLQLHPGKNPQLWVPPTWTKHIAFALMLPALIFLVAAYVPSRIRTTLKHPMLIAIKTWAVAHLIANGDLAGLVLFTSFLLYAVYDRISLKQRPEARGPLGAATGGVTGDLVVILVGVALYAMMMVWGHQALIGKALLVAR
jgi:uncharacterized membrane protein